MVDIQSTTKCTSIKDPQCTYSSISELWRLQALIASVACERTLTNAPERNAKRVRGDSEGSMGAAAQKAQLHSLDVLV